MKEVDQDLFVALQIVKANCATNKNCSECPMSTIYNGEGDLACIFQIARPYQLDLQIYDRIADALEGKESAVYYVSIKEPESEEEEKPGQYLPITRHIESEED